MYFWTNEPFYNKKCQKLKSKKGLLWDQWCISEKVTRLATENVWQQKMKNDCGFCIPNFYVLCLIGEKLFEVHTRLWVWVRANCAFALPTAAFTLSPSDRLLHFTRRGDLCIFPLHTPRWSIVVPARADCWLIFVLRQTDDHVVSVEHVTGFMGDNMVFYNT